MRRKRRDTNNVVAAIGDTLGHLNAFESDHPF